MSILSRDAMLIARTLDKIAVDMTENCESLSPRIGEYSRDLLRLANGIRQGEQMISGLDFFGFIARFKIGEYDDETFQQPDNPSME